MENINDLLMTTLSAHASFLVGRFKQRETELAFLKCTTRINDLLYHGMSPDSVLNNIDFHTMRNTFYAMPNNHYWEGVDKAVALYKELKGNLKERFLEGHGTDSPITKL